MTNGATPGAFAVHANASISLSMRVEVERLVDGGAQAGTSIALVRACTMDLAMGKPPSGCVTMSPG